MLLSGSVQVATHSLEVCLAPGEAGVQSLAVSPPGVTLADIQAFALQGGRGVLPLAVQQVHARLAADARRKLGLQGATPGIPPAPSAYLPAPPLPL